MQFNVSKNTDRDPVVDAVSLVTGGVVNRSSSHVAQVDAVRAGLNINHVSRFGSLMSWDSIVFAKYLHTTPKSLARWKKDKKPLNIQLSESALDIAKLTNMGIEYFGSVERWKLWLNTPNVQINNEKPNSVLDTSTGRDLIRRIIRSLEYGFVA